VVEGGEDVGVVRVLGQVRRDGREPVGEAGDGLAGDRAPEKLASVLNSIHG
jgi:hypothetical protein